MPYDREKHLAQLAAARRAHPRRGETFANQCTAKSKRTGERCCNYASPGRPLCRYHGARGGRSKADGSAPVSRLIESRPRNAAERERIAATLRKRLRRAEAEELRAGFSIWRLPKDQRAEALATAQALCAARGLSGRRAEIAQALVAKLISGGFDLFTDYHAAIAYHLGPPR